MALYEYFKGLKFFCFSEGEDRAHVHVKSQDGTAKFWLTPEIELVDAGKLKARDLQIARKRIAEMKDEYLKFWREHHGEHHT